jgi:hypothetical protein
MVPLLSLTNPIHSSFFKTKCNTILKSTPRFPKSFHSFRFSEQNFVRISHFYYAWYMTPPPTSHSLNFLSYWWRVITMQLFIMHVMNEIVWSHFTAPNKLYYSQIALFTAATLFVYRKIIAHENRTHTHQIIRILRLIGLTATLMPVCFLKVKVTVACWALKLIIYRRGQGVNGVTYRHVTGVLRYRSIGTVLKSTLSRDLHASPWHWTAISLWVNLVTLAVTTSFGISHYQARIKAGLFATASGPGSSTAGNCTVLTLRVAESFNYIPWPN